jgi:hypothetical protein
MIWFPGDFGLNIGSDIVVPRLFRGTMARRTIGAGLRNCKRLVGAR